MYYLLLLYTFFADIIHSVLLYIMFYYFRPMKSLLVLLSSAKDRDQAVAVRGTMLLAKKVIPRKKFF